MSSNDDDGPCAVHKQALTQGLWPCCQRKKDGKGCLTLKHCYLTKNHDKSRDILISIDGKHKMFLS